MTFSFAIDERSEKFARGIAETMSRLFHISIEEAEGRINKEWAGLVIEGEDDLIYHEDYDYWAHNLYYGHDSMWWMNPPDLTPLPYP